LYLSPLTDATKLHAVDYRLNQSHHPCIAAHQLHRTSPQLLNNKKPVLKPTPSLDPQHNQPAWKMREKIEQHDIVLEITLSLPEIVLPQETCVLGTNITTPWCTICTYNPFTVSPTNVPLQ
jgi:hypothetical protein